jgi:hypothetical protein
MIPAGENAFRLEPIRPDGHARAKADSGHMA